MSRCRGDNHKWVLSPVIEAVTLNQDWSMDTWLHGEFSPSMNANYMIEVLASSIGKPWRFPSGVQSFRLIML